MMVIKFRGICCSAWTMVVLTIVLTINGVLGRQIPIENQQPMLVHHDKHQLITEDMPIKDIEQDAFSKNHPQESAVQESPITGKWPSLRDLLFTADYDDNKAAAPDMVEELLNSHFLERLREIADNTIDTQGVREQARYSNWEQYESGPQAIVANLQKPLPAVGNGGALTRSTYKEHATKKNAQYMSPCHFKICNMGRKRDAQYLQ